MELTSYAHDGIVTRHSHWEIVMSTIKKFFNILLLPYFVIEYVCGIVYVIGQVIGCWSASGRITYISIGVSQEPLYTWKSSPGIDIGLNAHGDFFLQQDNPGATYVTRRMAVYAYRALVLFVMILTWMWYFSENWYAQAIWLLWVVVAMGNIIGCRLPATSDGRFSPHHWRKKGPQGL